MSMNLAQYIYRRDGFTLECNRQDDGRWTGKLMTDDGKITKLNEPRLTHNIIFTEAKAKVEAKHE
jgi:hypothetical protein